LSFQKQEILSGWFFGSFKNDDQEKYFSDFLSYGFIKNFLQADIIEMRNLISESWDVTPETKPRLIKGNAG